MKKIITAVALSSLMLVASCAKPTTYTPNVGAEERAAEAQIQRDLANQSKTEGLNLSAAEAQSRLSRIYNSIAQASATVCSEVRGVPASQCVYPVAMSDRPEVNAYADGQKVYVTPAMINFAVSDDELAQVLSHELAHNIMGHPQSQAQNTTIGALAGTAADMFARSQGYDTGGLGQQYAAQFAMMRYSSAFESEADYVGMYILARTGGYDYANAANFWRRMAARNPDAIYTSSTHPSYSERFVAMQKTAAEINAKKAQGQPLLPNVRR